MFLPKFLKVHVSPGKILLESCQILQDNDSFSTRLVSDHVNKYYELRSKTDFKYIIKFKHSDTEAHYFCGKITK